MCDYVYITLACRAGLAPVSGAIMLYSIVDVSKQCKHWPTTTLLMALPCFRSSAGSECK